MSSTSLFLNLLVFVQNNTTPLVYKGVKESQVLLKKNFRHTVQLHYDENHIFSIEAILKT